VALRVTLVRPEDLVEVRQAELPAVDLEPPGVPVLAGLERLRELHGERGRRRPGPIALRWHDAMVSGRATRPRADPAAPPREGGSGSCRSVPTRGRSRDGRRAGPAGPGPRSDVRCLPTRRPRR